MKKEITAWTHTKNGKLYFSCNGYGDIYKTRKMAKLNEFNEITGKKTVKVKVTVSPSVEN
jgi:hypothetical protein